MYIHEFAGPPALYIVVGPRGCSGLYACIDAHPAAVAALRDARTHAHTYTGQIGYMAKDSSVADGFLPVGHTCFFSIDLPRYSTLKVRDIYENGSPCNLPSSLACSVCFLTAICASVRDRGGGVVWLVG
jgi:hypothetical protein